MGAATQMGASMATGDVTLAGTATLRGDVSPMQGAAT
jgi:hypothetical protein